MPANLACVGLHLPDLALRVGLPRDQPWTDRVESVAERVGAVTEAGHTLGAPRRVAHPPEHFVFESDALVGLQRSGRSGTHTDFVQLLRTQSVREVRVYVVDQGGVGPLIAQEMTAA